MSPTIRIDDEVYLRLKEHAEPFVDTPNSVLRRLLGLQGSAGPLVELVDEIDASAGANGSVSGSGRPQAIQVPRKSRGPQAPRNKPKRTRVPAGSLLPEESYEVPLLTALVEAGGSGPSREIIQAVGAKVADRLTDTDKDTLASGGVRWESRVQFVRLRLVERGLMEKQAGRGIWAISEAGRKFLDDAASGAA